MKVFHVCTYSKPLSNVKQTAEMIKGQVKASNNLGIDTAIIMPLYKNLKDSLKTTHLGEGVVQINYVDKYVGVEYYEEEGLKFLLIDNMEYFYLDNDFGYSNDGERYTFFQYAVLECLNIINEYPDILHLHDWYCGLIPHLLKAKYKYDDNFVNIRTILSFSDITNQGIFPIEMEQIFDIKPSPILYLDGMINFLKAGIVEADYVITSSKTFYLDSKTKVINSRLRYSLRDRQDEYIGILSGIDYEYYNPKTDKYIYANYTVKDAIEKRQINKKEFLREFGFKESPYMLVGFSSDFTDDKGMDLLINVLEDLINDTDINFFFIGEGETKYIDFINYLSNKYPDRFKSHIGRSSVLTHKLYAACDMILQPYRYEPFSQGQMVAMHYGAISFTHEAGASRDFLVPYNQYNDEGNGFSLLSVEKEDFKKVFDYAYSLYRFDINKWNKMIINCLNIDFSWEKTIKEVIKIYEKALDKNN